MSSRILLFALLLISQPCVYADNSDSPYFKGGKIDAFYDRKDNGDFLVNSILWTPVFKGGHGVQISETGGQDINYFGGFARPLLTRPELGDLILGTQEVLQGDSLIDALFVGVGVPVRILGNTASAACWVITNASITWNPALGCNTILTAMTRRSFSA